MDGLLLVDKPSGPTSHDVVFRARRALREKRIGHTGTLDPLASGVLPLVVGRATRLARFLPGDKAYDAVVRLGYDTDTGDSQGQATGTAWQGPWPDRDVVDRALTPYRGTFLQQPPAFSAKKIGGVRSYALARRAVHDARESGAVDEALATVRPDPVEVTAFEVTVTAAEGDRVHLRVRCSAGFYIRSLAVDLGAALGTGGHLVALRRTAAAGFPIESAVPLDALQSEDGLRLAGERLVSMADMLRSQPAVWLTPDGVQHVRFGRDIEPSDCAAGFGEASTTATEPGARVRLLDPAGTLLAVATRTPGTGFFHPAVVLV